MSTGQWSNGIRFFRPTRLGLQVEGILEPGLQEGRPMLLAEKVAFAYGRSMLSHVSAISGTSNPSPDIFCFNVPLFIPSYFYIGRLSLHLGLHIIASMAPSTAKIPVTVGGKGSYISFHFN